jgi:archaemetzincin
LKPTKLYIIPIELSDLSFVEPLSTFLSDTFNIDTDIYSKDIRLADAYDPRRNQYYSSAILAQIIENPPPDAFRLLGITALDIFVPILTFLFGEAQFNGKGALISTFRLRNEFYKKTADTHLFHERILKEAVHELGHTYGLIHCTYPACVMNSSTYIEDVDEKSVAFCKTCAESFSRNSPK